jgi:shikimate dehydrogenase
VNRTAIAAAVAAEINTRFPGVQVVVGYPDSAVDLVSTRRRSLADEDLPPFDPEEFPLERARMAYDMVYRPAETRFLAAARAAGCHATNGLSMLLFQGARALEIWSGQPAPVADMRAALEGSVYGFR